MFLNFYKKHKKRFLHLWFRTGFHRMNLLT